MHQEKNVNARLSLSKDKIKVLLLEGIHQSAVELFENAGYTNVTRLTKALDGDALREALHGVHIVGIRSRTKLTEQVFEDADRLMAVGCFCIGTNQVTLPSASARGIPVFNAPFSNTRSVAELTIGEIVMLLRRIPTRSMECHNGGWDKSAVNSFEVRGKTLGIVGYGNIGSQLSYLAEAMGMRVVYFDIMDKLRHGNTEPTHTLEELLAQSDVVSLHVPETPQTKNMIGAEQFAAMKKGAYFINNARGTTVDVNALAEALKSGHLLGAAVDTFPKEPAGNGEKFASPLQGLDNVLITPHIGGSTEEAQERIGAEVARKLIDYSDIGSTVGAVNFPQVQLPPRPTGTRFMHVHRNVPGVMRKLIDAFSSRDLNIASQFLQTDGQVGYVVIEADGALEVAEQILDDIRGIEGTLRARIIYDR
ncbi:D-3-phosphoglycerate dehydrogenase [Rhodoblastus acidophilus]|uniref:D-3-phosphoglycerate dehydrogenase n=1 Tax=Rhodoblastus acidophilus TaxID=1074 RepID=A0A212QWW5_RHOAC|nr:phosphoglycerate dehydrogenase [Rhodoblastus acidophilus]PPQ40788.1 D-3-phosphoglycerate dehydrogenase [Rhodoblastus acidophilus]RAI16715.1 D-3-phosphoglycerate dehydrogenase [Rhodoblastus acidophilus]SNB64202.1 D-3-phosphoglycerate dehydrogenase [Rhodoblastus acidophilus]